VAFEIGVIRLTMTAAVILRVGRIDIWYGIFAALIIVVGFSRAIFAVKGWAYWVSVRRTLRRTTSQLPAL
jgi:putative membrane protein